MSTPYQSNPRSGGTQFRSSQQTNHSQKEQVDCQSLAWVKSIRFTTPLSPGLFSELSKEAAREINQSGKKDQNKPSQLRRFYDEIVMWEEKIAVQPSKFDEFLPFLRMLNAKAAYAKGRNVVSDAFVCLIEHTLAQVTDSKSMTTCKLFWEAFMGFYKSERPSD